ncbi:uncharacterized protein At1g15400-like [Ricinus communis]|uniref:uncharacterized protein At1g15400-like n=1 Tax=Ricinus communis TaxID=3988 RepID=UPI00201AA2B8|nr:uncharacterized protein At1g15400-like [Ricinus communis]
MAGLQRSAVSFRRQGSSGLVWDDKALSGELNQVANSNSNQKQEHDHHQQEHQEIQEKLDIKQERDVKPSRSISTIERSRSNGGQRGYRTGKVSPAFEPPSPRVSACGFCGAFGKPPKNHRKKAGKTRSR